MYKAMQKLRSSVGNLADKLWKTGKAGHKVVTLINFLLYF